MGDNVISGYLPLLIYIGIVVVLGIAMLIGSELLGRVAGRRYPTAEKNSTYECGMVPIKDARQRFDVRFYLVAMLFILFDIEVVFLYPWAVYFGGGTAENTVFASRGALVGFLFAEMLVFVVILFLGWYWVLKKRALDWEDA